MVFLTNFFNYSYSEFFNNEHNNLPTVQWLLIMLSIVFFPALILALTFYKKIRKNKKLKKINKDFIKPSNK